MKRYIVPIKILLIVLLSLAVAFLLLKGLYFTSVMVGALLGKL